MQNQYQKLNKKLDALTTHNPKHYKKQKQCTFNLK